MQPHHILTIAACVIVLAANAATITAQSATSLPRAAANDNRAPAGQVIDGELRVELEAVEAEWYPRGEDGPRIVTAAFAEAGAAPSVPGPLIRTTAGTPVQVTVHNRLAHAIEVRGFVERAADAAVPAGFPATTPAFLLAEPLVIPPGERRTARFTPDAAVSSFYFGRVVPADARPAVPTFVPGGIADEGAFVGALVFDDSIAPPHADERVFVITRWGSPDEPGSLTPSWKMMMNGRSWPHTERIELTVGDTAHWRIINTSMVSHPMHLHGFYFAVDALGNTQVDTVFASDARRDVVTEMMQDMSSLRLRWVPERSGNWLFHCHLIRHSGELQRFEVDRHRAGNSPAATHAEHSDAAQMYAAQMMDMDGMAGMILGISVRAADGVEPDDPPTSRRIDLWTGTRPGVYDGEPELGFVLQQDAQPPAPDSTVVPGSTLVLTRGEPTEIVVHNRLDIPLSVHWHGLELRSLYDGVGHWSGTPGSVRPPIEPGGSQRVVIEPPRAGTFFYHTHGEPGHELAQGLYGAFLVLEPDEMLNAHTDRLFMLGSRGARIDAPPAINGQTAPAPQRFETGRTYRLRFAHISPDEYKRISLLRDGEPVQWRARAKDGADLAAARRATQPAAFGIGVGEAYDFEWTPEQSGVYVLEVRTNYYPDVGGSIVQRVAFGVGNVEDEALRRATEGDLTLIELTDAQRRNYLGTFTGRLLPADDPREFILAVWEQAGRLYSSIAPRGEPAPETRFLAPLGDHTFVPGEWQDDMVTRVDDEFRIRFDDALDVAEFVQAGEIVFRFRRTDPFVLTDDELMTFAGVYGGGAIPVDTEISVSDGGLLLSVPGQERMWLRPVAFDRFAVLGNGVPPGAQIVFDIEGGRATALTLLVPGQPSIRIERMQ